jgi:hypothetical protein
VVPLINSITKTEARSLLHQGQMKHIG